MGAAIFDLQMRQRRKLTERKIIQKRRITS